MKNFYLLCLISVFTVLNCNSQEIAVSFAAKNGIDEIDSVHVANLTKNQKIKLVTGESVVFTPPTSIAFNSFERTNRGYLYPNPFDDCTTLNFITNNIKDISIEIYSNIGHLIYRKIQNLAPGDHKFQIQFPVSGIYNVIVKGNEETYSYKAVYTGKLVQNVDVHHLGSEQLTYGKNQTNLLKSVNLNLTLDYSKGDIVHYKIYSGNNTTIITDMPEYSKTIEVEFHPCIDDDNRNYKIVKIGDQWWMAENLAYLPTVYSKDLGSQSHPHYYVVGYQGDNVIEAKNTQSYKTYGVLYNWPAAMGMSMSSSSNPSDVQGVCPCGWHLPSKVEWDALNQYIDDAGLPLSRYAIGEYLRATYGWEPGNYGSGNGTNNFGFSALPGGNRHYDKYFENIGKQGVWWSSTESDNYSANYRNLRSYGHFMKGDSFKELGFSVRCVKDIDDPEVITSAVTKVASELTYNSAKLIGKVIKGSDNSISERGFYLSTLNNNPGKNDSVIVAGKGSGEFYTKLAGLQPNTTYYYRVYASNNQSAITGDVLSFKTKKQLGEDVSTITDSRDGKIYRTVKIGDQWWMAENLAYLPSVSPGYQEEEYSFEKHYYVYDYYSSSVTHAKYSDNFTSYGVFYNWHAAKSACPEGWHLPSDAEWEQLAQYISDKKGPYSTTVGYNNHNNWKEVGKHLKDKNGWLNNGNGTNDFGFSALPGGFRSDERNYFNEIGAYGGWWSSSGSDAFNAYGRSILSDSTTFWVFSARRSKGHSIRCLKD